MSKYLIVGGGGFIGGHLIKRLLDEGNEIRSADLKPLDLWFQKFDKVENFSLDMQEYENCLKMSKDVDIKPFSQKSLANYLNSSGICLSFSEIVIFYTQSRAPFFHS